ncbi:MAG: DMT family transporter [Alphaproteobacteria bacterium]|nr:DMT family transporter [Alphaproteobacteria bacterium]
MKLFPRDLQGTGLAIGLTILSVMIFGVQDACAKILVQTWSPFQITMMRYWAFGLFALLMVTRRAPLREAFRSRMPVTQTLRGLLLTLDIWVFALAIRTVPLAELQSIISLYPLVVTLMAIPLLGERVGPWRLGAVALGFVGVLVILRPGGLPLTTDVIFALCAVAAYSSYIVLTRRVAQVDSTATSMVYVGVVGMVLTTAVGVWFWLPMDWSGLVLVAIVMATTVAAHTLMMAALKLAPASTVQPFNYLALPWAMVLSIVVFGHFIDWVSLAGAVVIVGSGLIVWARERHRNVAISRAEANPPGKE